MNEVQKNAIREADNYLKYAGLPSFSSLFFGQPMTEELKRASLPAPQQATPELVGEVAGHFAQDKYGVWHMLPPGSTSGIKLYTRPAPGVPEGWRNVIAGALRTDPWASGSKSSEPSNKLTSC